VSHDVPWKWNSSRRIYLFEFVTFRIFAYEFFGNSLNWIGTCFTRRTCRQLRSTKSEATDMRIINDIYDWYPIQLADIRNGLLARAMSREVQLSPFTILPLSFSLSLPVPARVSVWVVTRNCARAPFEAFWWNVDVVTRHFQADNISTDLTSTWKSG